MKCIAIVSLFVLVVVMISTCESADIESGKPCTPDTKCSSEKCNGKEGVCCPKTKVCTCKCSGAGKNDECKTVCGDKTPSCEKLSDKVIGCNCK